mmetsp:Transcript_7800/g.23888  ORF Transcript_7800/g.23888 Transcript_7800/m.23888 type:complete len:212 (-) Transcript_7800:1344-1979(-)
MTSSSALPPGAAPPGGGGAPASAPGAPAAPSGGACCAYTACPSAIISCCSSSAPDFILSRSSAAMASSSALSLSSTLLLRSAGALSPNSSSCFFVWYTEESALFLVSTFSRSAVSDAALASASFIIRSTSSSLSVDAPVILMSACLPVPLSVAATLRMPLASMSKHTVICGTPRGAGGMPDSSNLPSRLLSRVRERSPSYTWMSTPGWLSA